MHPSGRGRISGVLGGPIRAALVVIIEGLAATQISQGIELGAQVATVSAGAAVKQEERGIVRRGLFGGGTRIDVKRGPRNGDGKTGHAARPRR